MENLEENDKIFGNGSFLLPACSPHLAHILLKNILAPFGCMQRWCLWVTGCICQIQSLAIETENDFAFLNMAAFVNSDQVTKLQVTTHYLQSQDAIAARPPHSHDIIVNLLLTHMFHTFSESKEGKVKEF